MRRSGRSPRRAWRPSGKPSISRCDRSRPSRSASRKPAGCADRAGMATSTRCGDAAMILVDTSAWIEFLRDTGTPRRASGSRSCSAPTSRRATRFGWSCWREPGASGTVAISGGSSRAPHSFRCSPATSIRQRRSNRQCRRRGDTVRRSHGLSHRRVGHPRRPAGSALRCRLRCPRAPHAAARRCGLTARLAVDDPGAEAELRRQPVRVRPALGAVRAISEAFALAVPHSHS